MANYTEAVYVELEDRHALYINDELVNSGDHMLLAHFLDGLTVQFRHRRNNEADQNWLDNVGSFPNSFDELLENEDMWDEDHRDD